jgi:ABC-2 type transport system permease protein
MVATVRPSALMGGKILGIGTVGLTQIGIWAVLIWLISNTAGGMLGSAGSDLLSQVGITAPMVFFFVVYFVLGFLFYAALYGAAGAMVNSDTEAQQIQTPITLPIVLALMLMFIAIRDPNNVVARIASMIPFFSPIVMMVRITVLMPPLWEIALSLAILLASIWGVLWVAGRIFRVGLLMYGKRPNLPELMKWIRYG